MLKKNIFSAIALLGMLMLPSQMKATKYLGTKVVDKDYIMVHFRDGEVRYRDDGTGPSAYKGHSFAPGDDTLKVFGPRFDVKAVDISQWTISSSDDKSFGTVKPLAVYRNNLSSALPLLYPLIKQVTGTLCAP